MRRIAYKASGAPNYTARIGQSVEAVGASVPAPIEGWDAISPLAAMSPKRAVRMINWFPQPGYIELRKGHVRQAATFSGEPVETLACYQGVGSFKLFAATGQYVYNVTSTGSVGAAELSGLQSARWQYINFATTGGNFLQMVNGVDTPRYYDGTSWHTAVITGITAEDAIHINAHKNRIWYVMNGTTQAAYLPVDSIQGAAATFELGGLFTLGGYLMAMATWSIDAGDGPDDYAVFMSSRGQVAIYRGTDPSSAATWGLVGVFNMGAPIGRRCFTKAGPDVAIICIDGVVPLSKVMIFERAAVTKITLTANIQRVMNQSARSYKDNFGWQLISYPLGTRIILNVPIGENSEQQQYVMNTLTGAWCQFEGMNANCWETMNDRLFFGGNDGNVYEADKSGADFGETITYDMMTAFNYFGQRGRQKRWMMCRPLLTTDAQVQPGIAFNVDFQDDAPISIPTTQVAPTALWDVAIWDQAVWAGAVTTQANWTSVAGIGYCASVRMVVDVEGTGTQTSARWGTGLWGSATWGQGTEREVTLQVNGFDLTMETGAFV